MFLSFMFVPSIYVCRFISEIMKNQGTGPFSGATLYQMIVTVQKYLFINKIKWKLIESEDFQGMRTVLDNVM